MIVKVASALLLLLELLKHSFRSPSIRAGKGEFYDHVFTKLAKDGLPDWSRPYASVFAVSNALSHRAYDAALSMLHSMIEQFPWSVASTQFLRKIFEVALIFGD